MEKSDCSAWSTQCEWVISPCHRKQRLKTLWFQFVGVSAFLSVEFNIGIMSRTQPKWQFFLEDVSHEGKMSQGLEDLAIWRKQRSRGAFQTFLEKCGEQRKWNNELVQVFGKLYISAASFRHMVLSLFSQSQSSVSLLFVSQSESVLRMHLAHKVSLLCPAACNIETQTIS